MLPLITCAAGFHGDRDGLASQRRFVDRSRVPLDDAIHRYRLAQSHAEEVAWLHRVHRQVLDRLPKQPVRYLRRFRQERVQRRRSPAPTGLLQRFPPSLHQRDHATGQKLAGPEGDQDRECRDDIGREVAVQHPAHECRGQRETRSRPA